MEQIAHGAEGRLYLDQDMVIKERVSKRYRIPQIDESLRKFRTRREAKILQKLEELHFPAPHLKEFSDKRMTIAMDFIQGEKLKDVLQHSPETEIVARQMGSLIGKLHANNIIHGDLTTSNMLLTPQHQLHFIDFGLSQISDKIEDKAVDLFLLGRALESTHAELYPHVFDLVLQEYMASFPEAQNIIERLQQVQARGRNKKK